MKTMQHIQTTTKSHRPAGRRSHRSMLFSIAAFSLALLAVRAWGAERILSPQEGIVPLYVSGLGHTGPSSNDWVATAFYYSPESIPGDYDLFLQPVYDPPVGVETPYVQGFFVIGDTQIVPSQMKLWNAPGMLVPIWFTPADKFVNGFDGIPGMTWTVNSMIAEGSLMGWADFYSEVLHPRDPLNPNSPSHTLVVASGFLEDGRSFWLKSELSPGYFQNALAADLQVHFGP
jgi:hypothetical protein